MTYATIAKTISDHADPVRATQSMRFFKTNKGQYGEGDVFLGITVPTQRTIARQYRDLSHSAIRRLLRHRYHEYRLIALFILVSQFERGDTHKKKAIVDLYLSHTAWVNNWDLVDASAHTILGAWLLHTPQERSILTTMARSASLWERRIAIVATWMFIRSGRLTETFTLSRILLHDPHDLIHKAVGWMLREAGKKDVIMLETFLRQHYTVMPRTMLRYAIEKFPEQKRKQYLTGTIS